MAVILLCFKLNFLLNKYILINDCEFGCHDYDSSLMECVCVCGGGSGGGVDIGISIYKQVIG